MKTLIVSIPTASGGTVELHHGQDKDTVQLDCISAEGKNAKGMHGRARVTMHRLELHQLYRACETAWQHMDADPALTPPADVATTGAAGQVSPNPEPAAG